MQLRRVPMRRHARVYKHLRTSQPILSLTSSSRTRNSRVVESFSNSDTRPSLFFYSSPLKAHYQAVNVCASYSYSLFINSIPTISHSEAVRVSRRLSHQLSLSLSLALSLSHPARHDAEHRGGRRPIHPRPPQLLHSHPRHPLGQHR